MSRELLILRHGKSDWDGKTAGDFDRPLAKRGRKAVKRMARWLGEQKCWPDRILSSPALRAKQTALGLCRQAGLPTELIFWREAIYEADLGVLLKVLAESDPGDTRVMIVGHNPGCEELVVHLTGQSIPVESQTPALPTAALAHLAMPDDWTRLERGCARLLALVRPRELE
ncbi:MAG: histidine phosphatase family protein [Nitrococcus mobilis]|nr:histidine phosphatase family protein [Nitrococcus mobilis]